MQTTDQTKTPNDEKKTPPKNPNPERLIAPTVYGDLTRHRLQKYLDAENP